MRTLSSFSVKCAFRLPVWIEACIYIHTVKSHFKALGLYNFKRGFGWAYKRGGGGGLISGWAYKRNRKKCLGTTRQNVSEKRIKAYIPLHFELVSYLYKSFIVRHKELVCL